MKFTVTMKDPDTLHDAIKEAIARETSALEGLSGEEREEVSEMRHAAVSKACGKWFKWGEYLTVEIDTDVGSCTVVPQ